MTEQDCILLRVLLSGRSVETDAVDRAAAIDLLRERGDRDDLADLLASGHPLVWHRGPDMWLGPVVTIDTGCSVRCCIGGRERISGTILRYDPARRIAFVWDAEASCELGPEDVSEITSWAADDHRELWQSPRIADTT